MSYTPPEGFPPPGGPPGYGQPAYGQPAYGQPAGYGGSREHPQGTTIMVLGILSLVVCGLLGPFAWSMGNKAIREIDANPGAYTNRGSVSAGRICGMISSILMILGVVAFVLLIALGSSSSTT
ncbi:MAG: hypothetical protein JWM47_2576 [Acidimicrobiales bacterium]|nr:hypothetical protein [Acidimicrobiales bacterium]